MADTGLAELFERAKQGDNLAFGDLLRCCSKEVQIVVRGRLPRELRTQFDSMDFVQRALGSIFTDTRLDLRDFDSPHHLIGYLAGAARLKVLEEHRRRTRTLKYNLGREEPLYVRKGDRDVVREVPAHDPSPSKVPQARERWAQILHGLGERDRQVVVLRRKGLTNEEIAARLGIHESAVRRVLKELRQRLGVG